MKDTFLEAIDFLPESLKIPLNSIDKHLRLNINEIRLRINKPLTVYNSDDWFFVDRCGKLNKNFNEAIIVTDSEIEKCMYSACNNSIYAHTEDIKNGFLTITGGHRIGFCGTYLYENEKISGQSSISSINIRIARQIFGCSDDLDVIFNDNVKNVLLCGPPQSGKTTLLRDIIRKISNGIYNYASKVVVIDERGEISAVSNQNINNDVGIHTDIIAFCKKKDGIINAIRSLSPDIIACDELGTDEDINALFLCSTCGVKVISTIHCNNVNDLHHKKIFNDLPVFFDYFVFLSGVGKNSHIDKILKRDEILC